jgi:4-amino-4-deoxy-L-arabinose transferase-like glycosyltransferase
MRRRKRIKTETGKSKDEGRGKQLAIIIVAAVLAAIPFCYGKYFEFGSNGPFDGSLNVYSARCIVNGQKIGIDTFPSARPATLLVNVVGVALFGFSELGPKLIQMLMQLTALMLMFYTLRKVYGPLSAAVALVLAAFYLSCPPYAKYGNVKEQFMIACAITAVCGVMLHHLGGARWWLLVSGAAAVNAFYFKQTGTSVIIAVGIYVLAQPILRNRKWRQFSSDVLLLLAGGVIGLLPLIIFYTWQGRLVIFLRQVPLIGYVIDVVRSLMVGKGVPAANISNLARVTGGEYIKGSKLVSIFRTQYDFVVSYYRSFVVPIGLCLLALIWRLRRLLPSKDNTSTQPEMATGAYKKQADSFVLLLGLWWMLDMAFVWVSPRSYVEYFLPLGGSGAMLAAYAVYRCRKWHFSLILLLSGWLVIDLFLVWVISTESFPYFACRAAKAVGPYWGKFGMQCIPLAAAIVIYLLMRKKSLGPARVVITGLICFGMFFWWNTGNMKLLNQRVRDLSQMRAQNRKQPWEQVAQYIRQNSAPDDGLYVWGWIPGIYVQAQRFSPALKASYSNMHSDRVRQVRIEILRLLKKLQANPPLYIVDTQKFHYPYYDHPNFDLWPRWVQGKRRAFHFRYNLFQPAEKTKLLSVEESAKFREVYLRQVEELTYKLLIHPNRKGGAVESEKARTMAETERMRHEMMYPLREFVMANYKLVPLRTGIYVFRHKNSGQKGG